MAGGVEYQVTKVDPTDPTTKGKVFQVHQVDEVTAYTSGKVYRARIIKDPSAPEVKGMVYQIVLIDDPDDPTVKGKVYNAILTGGSTVVIVGPEIAPLDLPDAVADGLKYVKAFGGSENRNLPEGYQELEYIEGNNNAQYINTGIVPTSSMSMYFKGQFVSVDESTPTQVSFLAGARDVGGQYGFFLQLAPTNVGLDWFVVNGRWTANNTRAVGDVVEMKVSNSLAQIWINGTSVGTHQYTPNDTTQYPLFLNGLNSVGQPFDTNVNVVNRIYRFTIDGIADMRPARRLSDGVLGMYDTIRKRFFTNAGTGSFVAGRDISTQPLPTGYTRLAYIESNGTQYIDTGLKVDQNTEIETVFQRTQLSNYFIYGINNAGGLDACSAYVTGTDTAHYWRFDDEYVNMQSVGGIIDTMWHRTIQNKNGVKLDSNNILAYTSIGTFETPVNMPVFCRYTTASSEYTGFAYIRISSFVMRKNGADILNFVPAKRNSDGAIGMYDTVSNTFFANAGTGTFAYAEYPTPTAPQDIWCNNGAIKAIRPLEYLQSTGTQYIDTGFAPSGHNIKIKTKLQVLDATNANIFFGEFKANEQLRSHPFNGNYFFGYATGSNNTIAGNPTVAVKSGDVIEYDWTNNTVKFNCNGTDYNYTLPGTVVTSDLSIWLFSLNTGNGQNDYTTSAKMYYFQVYDNDVLVRDMIPALDVNNIPCMFDKVEGKCYYNAGTGQFIAPYLPAEYEELEYIQGQSNAQYINAGIVPTYNDSIYCKFQIIAGADVNYQAFGVRDVSGAGNGVLGFVNTDTDMVYMDWFTPGSRYSLSNPVEANDVFEYFVSNKTVSVVRNGTLIGTNTFTGTQTVTRPLFINGMNNMGTPMAANGINRIYRFTITGVCDMIPARKRSNGHIGMYDLVRRQFFENAGEGQFTIGKLPILPDGYTQLEYLESTGTQYIDTGVKPNQDTSVELDGSLDGYGIIFGVRTAALVDISTIQGTSTGYWAMGYNTSADPIGTKDSNRHVWFKNKNLQYMDGELKNNYTYANFTAMGNAYLFAYNNNGTVGYVINGRVRVYSCKIWATADSMLVRYMIPAKRNSDGVVGMYDIMNDVFLTNQGTGDFEYGSEIPDSRESYYYVDGLVEKVGTHSTSNKNLFNGIFEQGVVFNGNYSNTNIRIRITKPITLPAGTYTVSCASAYELIFQINGVSENVWYQDKTLTLSSTDKLMICARNKATPSGDILPTEPVNVQIEAGSTATAYVPYCDGGLAVCENLLGIGSTQDVQEILTGEVTRKVGVFVLTGAEWWEKLNFADKSVFRTKVVIPEDRYSNPENNVGLCSHFTVIPTSASVTSLMNNLELAWNTNSLMCIRYDSMVNLTDFLAFLRSQYDAGTPVTIVYPLATDSTESVAGQTLTVSDGNNTAEIIQASIDSLMLEAKYEKEG